MSLEHRPLVTFYYQEIKNSEYYNILEHLNQAMTSFHEIDLYCKNSSEN